MAQEQSTNRVAAQTDWSVFVENDPTECWGVSAPKETVNTRDGRVVAVRRGGATHAYDTINHMFQMSRMILPGSTYWNIGFGLGKGEVREDQEGLANMRHIGKCIDWLGKCIRPHRADYPMG